ncbi:ankyrin repeat domain-containing protein [Streptomyces sp. NPDC052040]|uniref:ankyrin repeat domain-containing protein n=1 Tax=Streptomyces sp. NPDC052040 TaxID=3365682 RepID=UPI0037CFB2EB
MDLAEQFTQAAGAGDSGGVQRLLQEGVPVDVTHAHRSALDLAVVGNRPAVVRLLLDAGADPDQPVGEYSESLPLRYAATRGMGEVVRLLLAAGARPDGRLDEQQSTPLSAAAAQGHVDIVKMLLDCGASVEGFGHPSSDPLGSAAWSGELDVVQLLLARGAVATALTLESIRHGQLTAETLASQGHLTPEQLAEQNTRYEAVVALLENSMA